MEIPPITVIGGGLAGSEAAWQIARRDLRVLLYEMRPAVSTPAHQTGYFAELVCSNSFKSDTAESAPHLLKEELRHLGSLVLEAADRARVPAGQALAVDRDLFARLVTEKLESEPRITIRREEVPEIPASGIVIIATGPLTSDSLSHSIARLTGRQHLYFYDAISPVVSADTIDHERVFRASRYGKGGDDYINCPMTAEEYDRFYDALVHAESVPLHSFEKAMYFEGCLPLEELARRGRDTLRFGPMKPVGLVDPRIGQMAWAVVQLRQENLLADAYNLVGFQTHLRYPEQKRVFRLIPGLEQAEILRYGQVHRNTYLNSPAILRDTLQARRDVRLFFAGQISGVEGYVECVATGLICGINAARLATGQEPVVFPRVTACGSLVHYIAHSDLRDFQPTNINFAMLPPLEDGARRRLPSKRERHREQIRAGLAEIDALQTQLRAASAANFRA